MKYKVFLQYQNGQDRSTIARADYMILSAKPLAKGQSDEGGIIDAEVDEPEVYIVIEKDQVCQKIAATPVPEEVAAATPALPPAAEPSRAEEAKAEKVPSSRPSSLKASQPG